MPEERTRNMTPAPALPAGAGRGGVLPASQDWPDGMAPTIFHEDWWLDIASDGIRKEAVVETGGQLVGRLPYVVKKRYGVVKTVGMPNLVHALGPAIAVRSRSKRDATATRDITIMQDLVRQVCPAAFVNFRLHRGIANTLAFNALGYRSDVAYTVEVAPAPDALLWKNMRDKTRNIIRRAEESLRIDEDWSAAQFIDFYEANLRLRRRDNLYDSLTARELLEQTMLRKRGRLVAAINAAGEPEAAVFTIHDQESEYYFMSTRSPSSSNGAISLLIWTALRRAAACGRIFDMDGLHVGDGVFPNLHLLTGFGGTIRPRYIVRAGSALKFVGLFR